MNLRHAPQQAWLYEVLTNDEFCVCAVVNFQFTSGTTGAPKA